MRDVLKRKICEVDADPCFPSTAPSSHSSPCPSPSEWGSDGESSNFLDFTPQSPAAPTSAPARSILKRRKSPSRPCSVRFDQVTVFCFPRCQGFVSVPSNGGVSLGMEWRHSALHRYSVTQHVVEKRHRRREKVRERLREEKFQLLKHKLITSGAIEQRDADLLTADQVQDDIQVSDSELEDGGSMQPYSSRQRQALLHKAGVRSIDREEKKQLHALRLSREACGCDCQGFCEPDTCKCSLAGIKCQVDRFNFPCSCSKDGCGNTQGRFQFDARRVQTHHIHTLMRLELEASRQSQTLSQADPIGLPDDLEEYEDQAEDLEDARPEQGSGCPFGFNMEEDGLSLTIPSSPSFHFIPQRPLVEENSCSSDMTESSCCSANSDDSDSIGYRQNLPEVLTLNLGEADNKNYLFSHRGQMKQPLSQHSTSRDCVRPLSNVSTLPTDNGRDVDYLDENANQTSGFFGDMYLEVLPNPLSSVMDFTSSQYMDLSLSSDSDLEIFDSDYGCSPLHSSFKGHKHTDGLQHFQLFSTAPFPQSSESSTYLLESLIGLPEPDPLQAQPLADNLLIQATLRGTPTSTQNSESSVL